MDKKAAGHNGAAAVRLDLRFLLFRLHLFEGLAERGIAVGEQAHSLHDLVIGGVLTGMLELVRQILQLMGRLLLPRKALMMSWMERSATPNPRMTAARK